MDAIANVSFRYRKRFLQPPSESGFAEKPAAREPPPGKKPRYKHGFELRRRHDAGVDNLLPRE
jgi:hypothetical protein